MNNKKQQLLLFRLFCGIISYTLRGMVIMKIWKDKSDLVLDEYDENFYNVDSKDIDNTEKEYNDFLKANQSNDEYSYEDIYYEDESDYDNFTKVKTVDPKELKSDLDDDYEIEEEYKDNSSLMRFLAIFSVWFRRIGVVIAVILIAVFITRGEMKNLLLYILGLVASFIFGYGFMYILNIINEE